MKKSKSYQEKSVEKKAQFIDMNGCAWSDQMGDLKVGSRFVLYGDEICTVKKIDQNSGPGNVTYEWNGRECHGLPPIQVGSAWCEEKTS